LVVGRLPPTANGFCPNGKQDGMNFYKEAAKVLDDFGSKKQGSLKTLVFDPKTKRSAPEQKRLYALLSETLKSTLYA
jgi:hypothetical protein